MIFLYWLIIIIVICFRHNNAIQNKLFLKNDADNFVSEEVIIQEGKTVVQKYEYDSLGQVTQMTVLDKNKKNELASYAYSYDLAGNKLTSTETINGKEQTTDFTYDDNNRLLSMKNDDQTIKYEYDKNGNRVKQSGTDEVLDYIYDTENRLLAVKDNKGLLMAALYDGDDNRVFTASRTEDTTAYQLFKRQEKKGKGASKSTSTTRSGQDSRKSPKTSPNGEENSLFWYGFTENVIQGLSSLPETVGNLWMNVFDTVSRAYHQKIAKDRANEEGIVVNPPSLGNRPGEGEVTYSSEVNEVLIPYTTREDTYNYYEVRNYVNDVNQENTQVLQTYDDEMKSRETYTYGNERLSYTNEKTKDEYQYLTDARGSVTGMMKDGELDSSNSYSVFGTPEEVDETGNPFGYTGEAQDVTGYNYLRARYYDSQSGTFLTQDSYEGEEDNPLSQNGYTYVENNPINYADPTGHKKNFFQNLWSGVKKTAKKVVNKVKSVAKKVVNTVKRVVSNAYNTVKKVASNVWGGVKQAASYVYNGVRNTYNSVNNYFSGASSGRTTYGPPYYGSGANMISVGVPNSYSNMTYAQQMAAQTAYRQQRLNLEYQQVTGSKGKPKTKEGANLLKNWGTALKNTLTKFCKTAKKVVKNKVQSGVAFGVGFITQVVENNGIKISPISRFAMWTDKDWIKKNPAYNKGVFLGKLSGFAQAAVEYTAAAATFTGGNAISFAASPFTGGASLSLSPASTALAAVEVTHATGVLAVTIQNMKSGSNYSSSGKNSNGSKIKGNDVDFKQKSVDKAFGKHKQDFGNYSDGSKASVNSFTNDVKKLIDSGKQKSGTWRGTKGTHVYDSKTKQWAFINEDGSFNTAFKLGEEQYKHLIKTGVVK